MSEPDRYEDMYESICPRCERVCRHRGDSMRIVCICGRPFPVASKGVDTTRESSR